MNRVVRMRSQRTKRAAWLRPDGCPTDNPGEAGRFTPEQAVEINAQCRATLERGSRYGCRWDFEILSVSVLDAMMGTDRD